MLSSVTSVHRAPINLSIPHLPSLFPVVCFVFSTLGQDQGFTHVKRIYSTTEPQPLFPSLLICSSLGGLGGSAIYPTVLRTCSWHPGITPAGIWGPHAVPNQGPPHARQAALSTLLFLCSHPPFRPSF